MKTAAFLVLAFLALTGCSSPAPTAAPPSSGTPTSTSTPPGPSRSLAEVDPCALLTGPDLAPILKDTAPDPRRDNADGHIGCAWGDGEFRGVWLSFATGDVPEFKRQVPVGTRQGGVVEELEYTCDVRVDIDGVGIDLRAVASDKVDWCPEATAALTAAVGRLGW
ncbi:hypothetical protein [Alloactinosynnema sp. L-07]|uniref:DUF3558 family protein n=1 Tax=Alloactinosynnema sp. L-07 TaxID=1653480 RepID=UPI00065F0900|nr:DUF3558 family protein [Alloactinosynnema sp. L-07]CRK58787.1 hypothetical protein [Alloactinosynnema sp. L-07]